MRKLKVECKKCKIDIEITGEDPVLSFNYLTNDNKNCKKCGEELLLVLSVA